MSKMLIKISDEDAKKLYDTVVEVEASKQMYDMSVRQMNVQPLAIKVILDYYMYVLKTHKALWKDTLIKYLGEDAAAEMLMVLRYDPVKKVIFKLEIEGCPLCEQ